MLNSTMPKSVTRFERLGYAAIVLTATSIPLNWATISKYLGKSPVIYPLVIAAVFGLQVLWVWLIARKQMNWARWVSVVLLVAGLPQAFLDVEIRFRTGPAAATAYYIIYLMWLGAVSLLFTSDARGWFKSRAAHARRPETEISN